MTEISTLLTDLFITFGFGYGFGLVLRFLKQVMDYI